MEPLSAGPVGLSAVAFHSSILPQRNAQIEVRQNACRRRSQATLQRPWNRCVCVSTGGSGRAWLLSRLRRRDHEHQANLGVGQWICRVGSAVGAARRFDELRHGPETVEVTLVNRDAFHSIRVRRVEGEVTGLVLAAQTVGVITAKGLETHL